MQPLAPQPPNKAPAGRPSPGVLIWAALAALAVSLFAGMSLLALPAGTTRPATLPVTPSPAVTPPAVEDQPTPDLSAAAGESTPSASPTSAEPAAPPAAAGDPAALMGLWLSAVSAITALVGLASSLWLGWRKEGREMAQHRLELEKARLEIRKLEQELGATRNRPSSDAPVQ